MDLDRLRTQLRQIEADDPCQVRRRILEILLDGFGAKFGVFFKVIYRGGVGHWAAMTSVGDSEADERIMAVEGSPHLSEQLWNPWEPVSEEKDAFVSLDYGPVTRAQIRPTFSYQAVYEPLGIHDHARALLYDGGRFLGWIGLLRTAALPFQLTELAALNALTEEITSALVAAENLDGVWQDQQLQFVLDPDSMAVELASKQAARWLNPRRHELLESYVRQYQREAAPSFVLADGFELRAVELVGNSGTRFHVNVTAYPTATLGIDALLTPRQREVAELLAAGATNREIAEFLDVTCHTVKQHVKDVYKRLQITNRVELLTLLSQSSNPRFDFL